MKKTCIGLSFLSAVVCFPAVSGDYIIKLGAYSVPAPKVEVLPEPPIPTIDDENDAILQSADYSGVFNGNIGGYTSYGDIWIGNNFVAGLANYPSNDSWTVIVKTNGNHYFALTSFIDNPWTYGDSRGPSVSYIDGIKLSSMSNAASTIKQMLGDDLTQKQQWNDYAKGYKISGRYYVFKNRTFEIDRKWR